MELTLEFPCLPPSVNSMYVNSRSGGRHKSKEANDWDNVVKSFIPADAKFPIGILSVDVELYAPWFTRKDTVRRWDLDSRFKSLFDSVFKCFDVDDSCIFEIKARKVISADKKTVIKIYALDEY